jgi:hypothetical protein
MSNFAVLRQQKLFVKLKPISNRSEKKGNLTFVTFLSGLGCIFCISILVIFIPIQMQTV